MSPERVSHATLWHYSLLGVILLGALVLRVVGAKHGLPDVYSHDEGAHFVPRAVEMFSGDWNPGYFKNPPAFTYVLHLVLRARFGSGTGLEEAFAADPTQVFLIARVTTAALGVLGVYFVFVLGRRLADATTGVVAAALLAAAFLSVSQAYRAVNDIPAVTALCLSLVGSAGVLKKGRYVDYLLAATALGLATATKYTAAIGLVPLITAALVRAIRDREHGKATVGLAIAGVATLCMFLIANPYAALDFETFWDEVRVQTTGSTPKLGQAETNGFRYYAWVLTWGLGWLTSLTALGGALYLVLRRRREALLLLTMPLLYLLFMGSRVRFFSRWTLPVFPMLCVLSAVAIVAAVRWVLATRPRLVPIAICLCTVALMAQGLAHSTNLMIALTKKDTREQTREWMIENVPEGSQVIIEPVVPATWMPHASSRAGPRWQQIKIGDALENYVRLLRPKMVSRHAKQGICWVVIGATQFGRAYGQPEEVPRAIAYYAELEEQAQLAYHATPWGASDPPLPFEFDLSTHYYDMSYERPGPEMKVYRFSPDDCDPNEAPA